MKFYDNPHVIVDVGGQDIKLIVLKDGRVKDFKLNTQCSAGNGYFLQGTAESLGYKVEEYADIAFSANTMPVFGYGCAVFMQSDIVNFQRQGWRGEEILAGLANVLPKNIFLYVAGIPNLAKLGSKFILQGGTQNNLAAVKSEVDFIHSHFHGAGQGSRGHRPRALRRVGRNRRRRRSDPYLQERTSHHFHRHRGRREDRLQDHAQRRNALLLLQEQLPAHLHRRQRRRCQERDDPHRRCRSSSRKFHWPQASAVLLSRPAKKAQVEDVGAMRGIKAGLDAIKKQNPNFVDIAANEVWRSRNPEKIADPLPTPGRWDFGKAKAAIQHRTELMNKRKALRVGMPRVLNMYLYAPMFSAYLESLGLEPENLVYSEFTGQEMYRQGAGRGAIDPCFPSKIGIPHVYNLIFQKHAKKPLDAIFFPMIDTLHQPTEELQRHRTPARP